MILVARTGSTILLVDIPPPDLLAMVDIIDVICCASFIYLVETPSTISSFTTPITVVGGGAIPGAGHAVLKADISIKEKYWAKIIGTGLFIISSSERE